MTNNGLTVNKAKKKKKHSKIWAGSDPESLVNNGRQ